MKSLSIEDAFQWSQRFAVREWRLLLPVAFAFLALPALALALLMPPRIAAVPITPQTIMPMVQSVPWLVPASIVVELLALVGGLAIVALALVPRVSVREALSLAFQRLLVFVAALVLVLLGELFAATLLALLFTLARLSVMIQQSMLVGVLLGISLFLSVRLVVLGPVVIASRAGPIAALRLAWELTAGAFWRLLGVLVIYAVGGMIVVLASAFAFGAILVLGGRAIGAPDLGAVLSTVYLRVALAIFWMGFHVLGVAVYRQLGGTIRGT